MKYAAHDDNAIYAVADTPEAAIEQAKLDAGYGSGENYDAMAAEYGWSGFMAAPISDELAALIDVHGGNISWDVEDGVLVAADPYS